MPLSRAITSVFLISRDLGAFDIIATYVFTRYFKVIKISYTSPPLQGMSLQNRPAFRDRPLHSPLVQADLHSIVLWIQRISHVSVECFVLHTHFSYVSLPCSHLLSSFFWLILMRFQVIHAFNAVSQNSLQGSGTISKLFSFLCFVLPQEHPIDFRLFRQIWNCKSCEGGLLPIA